MRGLSLLGGGFAIGGRPRLACRGALKPTLDIDFTRSQSIPTGWRYSRASTATYFGADGLMHSAASGEPRFDYEPVSHTSRGLLIENTRTNQLTNSNACEKWSLFSLQVTNDGTLTSDGTTLARKITEGTGYGVHAASALYVASATGAWTYWVRLKPGTRTKAIVMLTDGSTADYAYACVDLVAQKVITATSNKRAWTLLDSSVTPVAAGWVECGITASVTSAISVRATTYLCNDDGDRNYAGDGVSYIYQGEAQLEPYNIRTSCIPTTTSAVTRAPDSLTTTSLSWLNPVEGTIVIDAAFEGILTGGSFAFSLDDGTNNGIGIQKASDSGALYAYSGALGGTSLGVSVKNDERFRGGIAWSAKGASASTAINGGNAVAIAQAAAVTPIALTLGGARSGVFASNIWIRSLKYWPRRLSDAELADATKLQGVTASA